MDELKFTCDCCGEHYESDEMNEIPYRRPNHHKVYDICDQCVEEIG